MKRFLLLLSAVVVAAVAFSSCAKEETPSTPAVTAVTINESLTLVEGSEQKLDVTFTPSGSKGDLTWRSSDSELVGVNSDGTVIAKAVTDEPVEIYALCGSIKSNICKVTVTELIIPVTGITLSETSLELEPDDEASITVTFTPSDATDKKLSFNCDSTVISFEVEGKNKINITALKVGETTLLVKSSNPDVTAECKISVTREIYNIDGSFILYDDMVSTNAPMSYGSVNGDASGIGLINGAATWPEPWWKYKVGMEFGSQNAEFMARKTTLALPSNLSDGDVNTCFMTNTDIFAPGEWQFNATKESGSYGFVSNKIWGKGLEYYGADLFPGWDGNMEGDIPLVNSDEDLVIPTLVDSHFVQIALPVQVPAIDLCITNSKDTNVYFRAEDAVKIMLSEDGESFQMLAASYSFDASDEIQLEGITYDADPAFDGKQIKYVRLTHNGTTSMTRDYTGSAVGTYDWTVNNEGWKHKGGQKSFSGNASPIAFSELKIWDSSRD